MNNYTLHLKHGHRTQSENLSMSNLEGLGESLPNPRYDLSMTPLTQDKFPEMSISSIPEKTRANDLRYGPTGVNPETGMPDGVTMSGLPFQIDESSTVQTQQSPEGSYVPITGADLGLPMGPGVPVPAGVEMGDPFQIVQSARNSRLDNKRTKSIACKFTALFKPYVKWTSIRWSYIWWSSCTFHDCTRRFL